MHALAIDCEKSFFWFKPMGDYFSKHNDDLPLKLN